jgi:aminoglycoside 3-N-acetyltransferase
MPTFTYSACKAEVFDPLLTPSKVGALTEFFRKLPGVRRTHHAIFSYAVEGPRSEDVLGACLDEAFGSHTVFDYLYRINAKYVLLGVNMAKGATNTYYSEQKFGVPYRYNKIFNALTLTGGKLLESEINYFVRDLSLNYSDDWSALQRDAISGGIALLERFNGQPLIAYQAQDMDHFININLKNNPDYLIKINRP